MLQSNRTHLVLALLAAVLGVVSGIACQFTSDGLRKDAEKNSATMKAGAKEMQKDANEGAEKAAEALSDAADAAGKQATVAGATFEVKTALMADGRVDASRIDVDSDGTLKVVHLRGLVTTQAEVDVAAQVAGDKAPGWRISNELVVAPRQP